MAHQSALLDEFGKRFEKVNGKPRPALTNAFNARRSNLRYDAAGDTKEYQQHWASSDALDADAGNSPAVRMKLRKRSRYEAGSNGFYAGILETHVNMVVGIGPSLRMLTPNRNFNQFVEKRFYQWSQSISLRRKLWCMGHARAQDGEAFAILQTNPLLDNEVQLDVSLIEAEQCQTPYMPIMPIGYIDGIKFDKYNNIEWYDILPIHPGSTNQILAQVMILKPKKVPPSQVLHWFKLDRPGAHRGIPALTSTLNVGAASRRYREAVLAGSESAADFNILIHTDAMPDDETMIDAFTSQPIVKRMITALPHGYDAKQMVAEFPTATHESFNRTLISEQARPLSMPYNAAACDSSTYSFASGKLDTLCYRAAIDVERQDCNDLVLDPLFAAWFEEWSILENSNVPPDHQWDWPSHPVIDAVSEATATDMQLRNGTKTLRQVFSDQGQDLEDQLAIMAEDAFGVADDASIAKMRQIQMLRNCSKESLPYVAQLVGVELAPLAPAQSPQPQAANP